MRRLTPLILLTALMLAGCGRTWRPEFHVLEASATPGWVQLELIDGRLMLPVTIQGGHHAWFLLDTGTTSTIVSEQLATRLGMSAEDEIRVTNAVGTEVARQSYLPALTAGGLRIEPHLVLISSNEVRTLDDGGGRAIQIDGILGFMAFQHQRLELDLKHMRLSLAPPDADLPPAAVRAPLKREDMWTFADTPALVRGPGGEVALPILIDTGWSQGSGAALPRQVVTRVNGKDISHAFGVMYKGRQSMSFVKSQVPVIEALGQQWQDVTVTIMTPSARPPDDWSPPTVLGLDQLLGLRLIFDAPNACVWVIKP